MVQIEGMRPCVQPTRLGAERLTRLSCPPGLHIHVYRPSAVRGPDSHSFTTGTITVITALSAYIQRISQRIDRASPDAMTICFSSEGKDGKTDGSSGEQGRQTH